MFYKYILLSSLLLASVTLAVPSSLVEDPFKSGREDRRSQSIGRVASGDAASDTWVTSHFRAGALLKKKSETFNKLTGSFTVPVIQGLDGSGSALLALDDDTCKAYVLAGITFRRENRKTLYQAWYQQFPGKMQSIDYNELTVNAGDIIEITILIASSNPGGTVMIEIDNFATGKKVLRSFKDVPLCRQRAGWFVEGHQDTDSLVNFGTVEFTGVAYAHKPYNPSDGYLININMGRGNLTSVSLSTDKHTVIITEVDE